MKTCPVCGEGKLHPQIEIREVEHNGHTGKLAMHYSLCDDCGSAIADAEEINKNAELMKEFRKNTPIV